MRSTWKTLLAAGFVGFAIGMADIFFWDWHFWLIWFAAMAYRVVGSMEDRRS